MTVKLFWLQCGGCGGDTWSLLNAESPDISELFDSLDIEVLWHPTISMKPVNEQRKLIQLLLSDEQELHIHCIEGSLIRGAGCTGMYDEAYGGP